MSVYRFPAYKRVPVTQQDKTSQWEKIAEEATETFAALNTGEGDRREVEECWDVIHACETFLRAYPTALVEEVRAEVEAKNRERGYYDA